MEGQLLPAQEQPPRADGWTWTSGQGVELEDPLLRQCFSRIGRLWTRRQGERLEAAVPWKPGEQVPVTPLFCLAEAGQVGDTPCLTFYFERGRPVPPYKQEEPGKS